MENIQKIIHLFENSGKSASSILKELEFSPTALSEWKKGKSKPTTEALTKIAKYFNVTSDYLLGLDKPPNAYAVDGLLLFPVIATISAGYDNVPILEDSGEFVPIPSDLIRGLNTDDYFVITVKGDSMYPKFLNGDNVLIKKCSSVDNGTIAVVGYNGEEATLKKVEYKSGEDWLKLIPINPDYKEKTIQGHDLNECRIYGKVVYLLRKF